MFPASLSATLERGGSGALVRRCAKRVSHRALDGRAFCGFCFLAARTRLRVVIAAYFGNVMLVLLKAILGGDQMTAIRSWCEDEPFTESFACAATSRVTGTLSAKRQSTPPKRVTKTRYGLRSNKALRNELGDSRPSDREC